MTNVHVHSRDTATDLMAGTIQNRPVVATLNHPDKLPIMAITYDGVDYSVWQCNPNNRNQTIVVKYVDTLRDATREAMDRFDTLADC